MKKGIKKIFGLPITLLVIGILAIGGASAALLSYFGTIEQDITVTQGISLNGNDWETPVTESFAIVNGIEYRKTGNTKLISNVVGKEVYMTLATDGIEPGIDVSYDTVGLSTKLSSAADSFANASLSDGIVTLIAENFTSVDWSSSEARITIDASDVGITTLNDLVNMSWSVDVNSGYIAHVDVIIDTNNNGTADDALVFEAAKVNPDNCELEEGVYPTGNGIDTLGRAEIIDGSSYAWLSSGAAGPGCVAVDTFYTNTLSGWKAGYQDIDGNTPILRFEIEVDPWIADSESEISNIVINGEEKVMETLSNPFVAGLGNTPFYTNYVFDAALESGPYIITTTLDLS